MSQNNPLGGMIAVGDFIPTNTHPLMERCEQIAKATVDLFASMGVKAVCTWVVPDISQDEGLPDAYGILAAEGMTPNDVLEWLDAYRRAIENLKALDGDSR